MMDYLEALLPQEEGEDVELELAGPLPRRRWEAEAGAEGPASVLAGEMGEASPEDMKEAGQVWAPLEAKGRRALWLQETARGRVAADGLETASPEAAVGETPHAGRRSAGAAALLERLGRARQVAGYAGGSGGGAVQWSVPQEGPPPGGTLALEELDRAVQRDARRYDGGFALF